MHSVVFCVTTATNKKRSPWIADVSRSTVCFRKVFGFFDDFRLGYMFAVILEDHKERRQIIFSQYTLLKRLGDHGFRRNEIVGGARYFSNADRETANSCMTVFISHEQRLDNDRMKRKKCTVKGVVYAFAKRPKCFTFQLLFARVKIYSVRYLMEIGTACITPNSDPYRTDDNARLVPV